MNRPHDRAKDALIRAAAKLTTPFVDTSTLAEAFTELAGGVAHLSRVPGADAIAHDFARMIAEKVMQAKVEDYARAPQYDVQDVRKDLDACKQRCPHCGKEIMP